MNANRLLRCMVLGILFLISPSVILCRSLDSEPPPDPDIQIQNDRITILDGEYARSELLDALSRACGVEILVIGAIDDSQPLRTGYRKARLETILQSILKGASFAIVKKNPTLQSVRKHHVRHLQGADVPTPEMTAGKSSTSGSEAPSPAATEFEAGQTAEATILSQMVQLEKRIRSGESDREYEIWASVRGPEFAVHDRDRLSDYEKELEAVRHGN